MRVLLLIAVACLLAGCGDSTPRIDATNKDTFKKSLEAMTAKMSKEEGEQFAKDVTGLVLAGSLKDAIAVGFGTDEQKAKAKAKMEDDFPQVFKDLHGMSVEDIRKKLREKK